MLTVGFSETDITPAPGRRTAGMVQPPVTEGILHPLFARIIVFDDGVNRAAIATLDNLGLAPKLVPELRQAMAIGSGLAPTDIMLACTHTHSAPHTAAIMDAPIDFDYVDFLRARLVTTLNAAMAARQTARLKTGKSDVPGWTFNRRQIYHSALYGEQVGTQGPQNVPDFIRNEGPEDNSVQVLWAETPQGQALGGLVNFACHPTLTYGEGKLYSADYPGPLTELLARRHGGIFAFLQGASGNLWGIDTNREGYEYGQEHVQRMVTDLADKIDAALAQGAAVAGESVCMARKVLRIPQRRPTKEQVELARWYLEKAPPEVDQQEFTRKIYGHDYTFYHNNSIIQEWFARETISLWEWQRRMDTRELIEDVEIQAIVVGNIAFVGFPAEYFTEFGLKVKTESPFPITFITQLTNGWHGYVPTQEAFAHGGYETRLAYSSRLVPEAGDRMCEAALQLLKQI